VAINSVVDVVSETARRLPCRVQKASVDATGRLILELYVVAEGAGHKAWLVVDAGSLAWCDERPARRGADAPTPAAQALARKELVPGVLLQIVWTPPLVRLTFATVSVPRPRVLVVEHTGDPRAVLCVAPAEGDETPRVLSVFGPRPLDGRDLRRGKPYVEPRDPPAFVEGVSAGKPLAVAEPRAPPPRAVDPLAETRAALRTEARRLKRLVDALTSDLLRHGDAVRHQTEGELLKTVLTKIRRGSAGVDVVDWDGHPRTLALDPTRDARANLEERFKRARRARASATRTAPRLDEAKARLAAVDAARHALADGGGSDALALASALLTRPDSGGSARRKAARQGKGQPWRSFCAHGDVVVRVGRGARDNDALRKTARGHDVWLHARNHQGAHVIVPSTGSDVDPELMLDAAHLAAHFSSARGEARVDVQHTRVKNVKKAGPGSPAGLVLVAAETVLHLRVERARLAALLAREIAV
jgi:hypothetical protein